MLARQRVTRSRLQLSSLAQIRQMKQMTQVVTVAMGVVVVPIVKVELRLNKLAKRSTCQDFSSPTSLI